MGITVEDFGNKEYKLITLQNKNNMKVVLTNIGASVVSIFVKDLDIVLGFANCLGYLNNEFCLGATIGRNANRIENGIFKIDNEVYKLDKNDGENNLHSGFKKTTDIIWKFDTFTENDKQSVIFSTLLKDGFQNMKGNFNISVKYTLKPDNTLELEYCGKCDFQSIFNFTNHTYFNLNGHTSKNILNHKIQINSEHFTPFKKNTNIPSGEIRSVKNTPMDFFEFKTIKDLINEDYSQLNYTNGYDHNYVIKGENKIKLCAKAFSEESQILLETFTDLPGVHFYTGNFNNIKNYTKNNAYYGKNSGFCFETQFFPNSVNIPQFASPIIEANREYKTTTIYKLTY